MTFLMLDPNTLQVSRTLEQYYAATGLLFGATPGIVTLGATGGNFLVWQNPSNSGLDLVLSRVVLSCEVDGAFYRYRGGTLVNAGTVATLGNRAGSTGTAAKGKVYSTSTISGTSVLEKVSFLGAYQSDPVLEGGSIFLKPGGLMFWSFVPTSGRLTSRVTGELVWWEVAA
jgi:hypothetical protein